MGVKLSVAPHAMFSMLGLAMRPTPPVKFKAGQGKLVVLKYLTACARRTKPSRAESTASTVQIRTNAAPARRRSVAGQDDPRHRFASEDSDRRGGDEGCSGSR